VSSTVTLPNNWHPRPDQMALWAYMEAGGKRAVEVAHRRWGKDDCALHYTATAVFQRVGNYWHMLPKYDQARKAIWDAVNPRTSLRRIDEAFPKEIRKRTRNDSMFIEFRNGSTWQLVGSDNYNAIVGSPPVGLVLSEWALADPMAWAYLSPILEENGGWVMFVYTSRGNNHGKTTFETAKRTEGWFAEKKTAIETKVFSTEQLGRIQTEYIDLFGLELGGALFSQEYLCVPASTLIWTDRGQKPIEGLSVGDIVLTHAGRWRKITKCFCREYEDDLCKIKSSGNCQALICTPEHPVRTYNPKTQKYEWEKASDITGTHWITFPKTQSSNSFIKPELIELIGWYITEGSVMKNAVSFSLNKKETHYVQRIQEIAAEFGKCSKHELPTAMMVQVCSCRLADFLVTHCGSGAANKRIPWNLISGHEELLYNTLIDGDGCRGQYKSATEVYSTISLSLARDVQMLAHIIGKRARINKGKTAGIGFIEKRKCNFSDSYNVFMSPTEKKKCGRQKVILAKHSAACKVLSVEKEKYIGKVYNIAVQFDESYVANGVVVHNCDFAGAVMGAYYATAIAKARAEKRVTVVPWQPGLEVDTFWDLGLDDSMSIWFMQPMGKSYHWIDYCEGVGFGMEHYAKQLKAKPYVYGNHWMPHDARNRELSTGEIAHSVKKTAENLGIKPIIVVDRARNMDVIMREHIPACRNAIAVSWFDEGKCSKGLAGLENYRSEYSEKKKKLGDRPLHDWTSHPADAFRTFGAGYRQITKQELPKRQYLGGFMGR